MKSWLSKASAGLSLLAACGTMSSCALHGNGYAGQTEVETDVPESLEHGKPSKGPSGGQSSALASNAGVPATSNLIESPEADVAPAPPPLPAKGAAGAPGGASVVGLNPDN